MSDDMISRASIIEALRDAHRNDSAADAVEFVSDVVGWSADDDPVLQAESEGEAERFFKLTLSERQLEIVELALESLSAGDEDAQAENDATLTAVRDSAEEVR